MVKKAVALISGGLDSVLAAKVIADQGFDVLGLYCTSAFSKSFGQEQRTPAAAVAQAIGITLRVLDLGQDYIDLIRNPRHGYGKNANPCIDCKIFMLSKAKELMEETGASFVVTGEVLGQRPMSQRRDTLRIIERDSGMHGMIVRPLSAKHLEPTTPERDGLVDRDRLLGISGRGRSVQFQLAERYGITGYSNPAGGCLLTDENFSARLLDLFQTRRIVTPYDIRLLTVGRHFKFDDRTKIVVGRDSSENSVLISVAAHGYHLFSPEGYPGPVAVLDGSPTIELKQAAGRLIVTYSKRQPGMPSHIRFGREIFDPGDPLPIETMGLKRVGAGS